MEPYVAVAIVVVLALVAWAIVRRKAGRARTPARKDGSGGEAAPIAASTGGDRRLDDHDGPGDDGHGDAGGGDGGGGGGD